MKVLCLDQSTSDTGWCLIEDGEIVNYGVMHLDKKKRAPERMMDVVLWLEGLEYKIDELVFEEIQMQGGNVTTFQVLAQLQGFLMQYAIRNSIPYTLYSSSSWKSTCGVKGRARVEQKANAHLFVEDTYGVSKLMSQDAVDAICIAHHHINKK